MYAESEKKVFSYWAGPITGPIHADPYNLLRKFTITLEAKINTVLAEWYLEEEVVSAKAEQKLVDASRVVFKMDPFDDTLPDGGGGANDNDVLDVLIKFLEFLDQKKSDTLPTQTQPTGSPESSPVTEESTTKTGSVSG